MAEKEVCLPPLGDDDDAPEEAKVSFFYFEEGSAVKKDDDLAEFLTDKATFDLPCPADGTLKKILVQEEETVKVGQVVAIIEVA
jgi:pyruvate/2-oxoglutarate dehydrogenase complex dihydrolipoamide acyltransferase (E2) component